MAVEDDPDDGSEDEEKEVDPPNSGALSRKVRLRDGLLCTNPHCCRAARQSHHVKFRQHGGRTALYNEVAVCEICHALIHQGRLRVAGSPSSGLDWSTRADGIRIDLAEEQREIAALPVVRVFGPRVAADLAPENSTAVESGPGVSTAVESEVDARESAFARAREEYRCLPRALKRLGYTQAEAEELVDGAIRALLDEGTELGEQEIIQQALCPGARGPSG